MPTQTELSPWVPELLHTAETEYGAENWLARFSDASGSTDSGQAVKEEVQALFARWLRMQNLCVLMGAGASLYATSTLNSQLLAQATSLLKGRQAEKTLAAVGQFASDKANPDRRIELFLTQLQALCSLFDAERAIAAVCNVNLPPSSLFPDSTDGNSSESVTAHENFFAELMARDPQDGRAKVFTPNYDTLIEQAMDRNFPGEAGEGRVRRYHTVVQLYKLHASIDWRRRREASALSPYGIRYDAVPIPSAEEIVSGKANLDGVLTMPFAHMFRSFGHALLQPQTVLSVIGYSGGDDHIRRTIHDALVNPGFTCVIVDPYPARNWFFGSGYFPFFIPSDTDWVRNVFTQVEPDAVHFWTRVALTVALGALMARAGLAWGGWMRKVRR
jgi:hypothetical protein